MHTVDNIAENFLTNTWCFGGTSPANDAATIENHLATFYTAWWGHAGLGMAGGSVHEVKWYDLPGLKPNYPWRTSTLNFGTAPSTDPMPAEVALVLSFQGAKASGFPQRRRRGRIYLGTVAATKTAAGRPAAAMVTAMAAAAGTFKANVAAISGDTVWAVWSGADNAHVEITNGWIDNSWDTQRRRGLDTTARTTFA